MPKNPAQCVLVLGNFDGVHIGHQQLLRIGRAEAAKRGVQCAVLLFDPHPAQILRPEEPFYMISALDERIELLAELGVDAVVILAFTLEFAALSPQQFIQDSVLALGAVHIVVGFNYTFGMRGQGRPDELQQFGRSYGFGVTVVSAQKFRGKVISSTSIREALQQGDIELAAHLLGRYPSIQGKVVTGEQRGRLLGFPTANLHCSEQQMLLKRGAYVIHTFFAGVCVYGMMNIGVKPTFHNYYETTVEIHLFDFAGDLYGKELQVQVIARLREEIKFSSLTELRGQLACDERQSKQILNALDQ
jgi:riboflavin kinase/FMN adenylyltransferase